MYGLDIEHDRSVLVANIRHQLKSLVGCVETHQLQMVPSIDSLAEFLHLDQPLPSCDCLTVTLHDW